MFSLSRYPTLPAKLLSLPPVVAAGDASYSIYLFHLPALQVVSFQQTIPLNRLYEEIAASRYIVFLTLLILFASACTGSMKPA